MAEPKSEKDGMKRFFTPGVVMQIIGWVALLIMSALAMTTHVGNDDIHMPYEKKVEKFILKESYDADALEVKEDIKEIKEELKELNNYIRETK